VVPVANVVALTTDVPATLCPDASTEPCVEPATLSSAELFELPEESADWAEESADCPEESADCPEESPEPPERSPEEPAESLSDPSLAQARGASA
jgi:hypothetical protein